MFVEGSTGGTGGKGQGGEESPQDAPRWCEILNKSDNFPGPLPPHGETGQGWLF